MAREVVDLTARVLSRDHHITPSGAGLRERSALPGGAADSRRYRKGRRGAMLGAWLPGLFEHLVRAYGADLAQILALLNERPGLAERIAPDLPVIGAQAVYAVRHEMALTLEDVLDRRTHVLNLAADQGLAGLERVADLVGAELGWTPAERADEIGRYRRLVALSRRWRALPADQMRGADGLAASSGD
jgi:glycerol-3-phosphate dehydrogenase